MVPLEIIRHCQTVSDSYTWMVLLHRCSHDKVVTTSVLCWGIVSSNIDIPQRNIKLTVKDIPVLYGKSVEANMVHCMVILRPLDFLLQKIIYVNCEDLNLLFNLNLLIILYLLLFFDFCISPAVDGRQSYHSQHAHRHTSSLFRMHEGPLLRRSP